MSRVHRNNPERAPSSESRYTFFEFQKDFPDDAACLEWLVGHLYPEGIYCSTCKRVTKHHRVKSRPCYACQFCGRHEYPMKGTIFQDSATSLRLWFHAMFLMSSTRCGISAKQLERELGVTYKTAWRIFNRVRSLLAEIPDLMSGTVEVDETYIGGKMRGRFRSKKEAARARMQNKEVVAGHVQRGGKVRAIHLPDGTAGRLLPLVHQYVLPASMVYTDELPAYTDLGGPGYKHHRVNHSAKVFVSGDVHTNTIDEFWALLKHGLRGVYHGVSAKWLQAYLNEYTFRYNHREHHGGMFNAFLSRLGKQTPELVS